MDLPNFVFDPRPVDPRLRELTTGIDVRTQAGRDKMTAILDRLEAREGDLGVLDDLLAERRIEKLQAEDDERDGGPRDL